MLPPHHPRILGALAVALIVLLAGCLGAAEPLKPADTDEDSGGDGLDGDPLYGNETDPRDTGGNGSWDGGNGTDNSTNGNSTGGDDDNVTGNDSRLPPEWPDLADAKIRPGMAILLGNAFCTTNFVFRSTTNDTLYIGTAAHCVGRIGQEVQVVEHQVPLVTYNDGPVIGRVVYSSWATLGEDPTDAQLMNDFALIEVQEDSIGLVHPAMLHFGGPVKVADGGSIKSGEKVLAAGNTPVRPGPDQLDGLEGKVMSAGGTWSFEAYFTPYSWGGDSGSGVMTADGEAAGILVRAYGVSAQVAFVYTSHTIMTKLDPALEHAAKNGFDVELQTWELTSSGKLPL